MVSQNLLRFGEHDRGTSTSTTALNAKMKGREGLDWGVV